MIYIYMIYIYIPEKGGTKASPQSNAHVFFVSALKYLEVKAVLVVSIPRYFRPDQLQLGRFRPNPGQEPFGARSRAETCWKQFSAIGRPFGRLLHFAFGKNGNGYIYNFRTNSKQTEAMNQHCEAKTHRPFYTQTLADYTQTFLHTNAFTHRHFFTSTHRCFYTQTPLQ